MLSYVCRVGKSRHDLISGELVIFLDLFDLIARGESPEHGCDIDSCTLDARFSEANRRVHCNARINFHRIPHSFSLYPIYLAECHPPISGGNKGDRLLFPVAIAGGGVIDPCHARAGSWGSRLDFVCHVISRGNGRATIFHKPQDYFGLRLFQTFQTPVLRSIEGFNPPDRVRGPFKTLKSAKTRCLTSQKRSVNSRLPDAESFSLCD